MGGVLVLGYLDKLGNTYLKTNERIAPTESERVWSA